MAEGVGFFSRLKNLWRGFLSLWIEGIEAEHPEAVYEAAIEERIKQYNELKKAVSGLVYMRNKLQADLEKKTKELNEVQAQIPVAVESGEDDVALVLIEKKDSLTAEIAGLRDELAKAEGQADEAKSSLLSFQGEINKLKSEKDEMLAKRANAQARIQIQESLDGLSTDADIKALDGVRESIQKMSAEADVGAEIGEQSLDKKLEKIKQKTASSSAKAQLAALKQAKQEKAQEAAPVVQQAAVAADVQKKTL